MSSPYLSNRDESTEDVVYKWQGYSGDINLTSFPVFTGKSIQKISVGGGHSLYLTSDKQVYGQGKNDRCQTAISGPEFVEEPQIIESLSDKNVVDISCGVSHSGAICDNGDVYCWGDNSRKQCGVVSPDAISSPVLVSIRQTGSSCEHGVEGEKEKVLAKSMACGAIHTMILSLEGEVWTWGEGIQLGLGEKVQSVEPCKVESLSNKNVIKIYSGHSHSAVLVSRSSLPRTRPIQESKTISDIQTQKYYPSRCADCNTEIYTYTDSTDTCIIDEFHVCSEVKPEFEKSIDSLGDSFVSNVDKIDLTFENTDDNKVSKTNSISETSETGQNVDPSLKPDTGQTVHSPLKTDSAQNSSNNVLACDPFQTANPTTAASTDIEGSTEPVTSQVSTNPTTTADSIDIENSTEPVPSRVSTTLTTAPSTDIKGSTEPVSSQVLTNSTTTAASPDIENSTEPVPSQVSTNPTTAASIDIEGSTEPVPSQQKSEHPISLNLSDQESSASGSSVSVQEGITNKNESSEKDSAKTQKESNPFQHKSVKEGSCPRQTRQEDVEQVWQKAPSPEKDRNDEKRSSFGGFVPYSAGLMQNIKSATSKAFSNLQNVADKFSTVASPSSGTESVSKSSSQESGSSSMDSSSSGNMNFPLSCSTGGSRSIDSSPTKDFKDWSPDKDRVSKKPQSIRTFMARQEQLGKRTPSTSTGEEEPVVTDTEIWVWGRNSKGQLGLGDNVDRNQPVCIKMMNGKQITAVACGHSHCVAATANSQVYTWGHNGYLQLGHNEINATPCRVKFMKGCYVWDVAAGDTFSLFLADSSGMKSSVFYCGKHPSKDATTPLKKTMNPTTIGSLKKCGWVRQIQARGDNCFCFVKPGNGTTAAMFEFAASERGFHQHLNRIINAFIKQLLKSEFYTTLDVYPYKTCLQNLLQSFQDLTKKVAESITEVSDVIRDNNNYFSISLIVNNETFIEEFRRYSTYYCDMLAVGGFEYCAKVGSVFFDQCRDILPDLIGDKTADRTQYSLAFRRTMEYPLNHLKLDYRRFFGKMVENIQQDSEEKNLLNHAMSNWDILKWIINSDNKMADNTRVFWETAHPKICDSLKTPSRRLLRDSKNNPLMLPNAGRFTNNMVLLFNDGLVHTQNGSFQLYPLYTVWVESHSSEAEQQNVIIVTTPEDTLTLVANNPEDKADWFMTLNSTINKNLTSVKSTSGRRNSIDRLTPPLIRHVTHTFTKHCQFKDALYNGFMLNGKMHGQGELIWTDGRTYYGKFSQGLQQGHGKYTIPTEEGLEIQEGNWKDGSLNGYGTIKYANGDVYKGYFKNGLRFGHGIYNEGHHMSHAASIFIGEWSDNKRHGYGVQDDISKGEKYMGMWQDGYCHGNGVVVTLDGMYFEGNFVYGKLTGFGLMLTDDNSFYEGEFQGVTQLQGKGCFTLPTGDRIEGLFNGSWNEGLKINGTFHRGDPVLTVKPKSHALDIKNEMYGKLSVKADNKWSDIFKHTLALLGYRERKTNPNKAWEVVAVRLTQGQKVIKELEKRSPSKARTLTASLESLQTIPPYNTGSLSIESYHNIVTYLTKACDNQYHPMGNLIDSIVDVFRAAYIGVGAHPRLLHHAVEEIRSYVKRMYVVVRLLFPDLPAKSGPVNIYQESSGKTKGIPTSTEAAENFLLSNQEDDEPSEVISAAGLLYPILLPKIYPPLFDLYALYNDKDDETCWERVTKLNRQGDMALMAYLGIDERFWLMEEVLKQDKSQKLSAARDQCYASAVDTLQQLSTAFSPIDKLKVIESTFQEITETVQASLKDDLVWNMDDLFPIFQYVVVRAKIRHLGAEVHMIDDLMESHLEFGELGMMFTTLKACYFQIQTEKLQNH